MTASVELDGIPETMLWVLYNRANEARRPDTYLHDPDCVRVYESIDYDFERRFGKPHSGHPMRSKLFDDALRPWLATHPGGTVIELGAGLETQFQRYDDGEVSWLCIDVPEAIAVRERFLPPTRAAALCGAACSTWPGSTKWVPRRACSSPRKGSSCT